jgi:hypothetical protein
MVVNMVFIIFWDVNSGVWWISIEDHQSRRVEATSPKVLATPIKLHITSLGNTKLLRSS